MDLLHLRLEVITFMISITFIVNYYRIYGFYYIYGSYSFEEHIMSNDKYPCEHKSQIRKLRNITWGKLTTTVLFLLNLEV